ncbi:TRAFs-binding domain-containing protein [Flagellimonas algicola]|uniref:DUF4071 domain-containing protein n=1 Tax=Flagellimonas algicola TaxID=2583815 RepID=A0ABY2WS42_9FLAO|nr:TRAFs-binding domain-containing protein [Allomuricauda algicola]TMU57471.1 DUF4071 domain-containing protein [Allomuricauda algicola]
MKPLCFVLMPFGIKVDKKGRSIDFNQVYELLIKPAIEVCNLEPIRADEELLGGTIHTPMFERLILCDYAIADLTSLNANVFYELGLRHAIKAHTTIPIFAFDTDLPFDLKMQRTLPYNLIDNGELSETEDDRNKLVEHLKYCIANKHTDSPVFQLIDGWQVSHNLSREKTDVFREQAVYDNDLKEKLSNARITGNDAVLNMVEELKPINEKSVGVVIDLFLSLRGISAWDSMIECYEDMDKPLQKTKLVQEQLGLALNRSGASEKAQIVLEKVLEEYGADPETNGILGRVFKDLHKKAKNEGNRLKSNAYLTKAIKSYKEGFDADWRDAYPGVNLVTLLEQKGDEEELKHYLPIVQFANKRKMESSKPDYWDLATESELYVLGNQYDEAFEVISEAIALIPPNEGWMLETTLNNFRIILDSRKERGKEDQQLESLILEIENSDNPKP